MKKLIITLLFLMLPTATSASVNFNGSAPGFPHRSAGGLLTIFLLGQCWFMSPDNVAGGHQSIFTYATAPDFEPVEFYISLSTFHIIANAFCIFGSCDDAHFTFPVSNGDQVVCVDFNFNAPDSDTPSVWVNGVKKTVTTVSVGDGAGAFTILDYLFIGVDDSNSFPFDGRISTITLFTNLGGLSEDQLRALSSTRDKKQLLDGNGAAFHWRLDEVSKQNFTATTSYPNTGGFFGGGHPTTTLDFRNNASSTPESFMSN